MQSQDVHRGWDRLRDIERQEQELWSGIGSSEFGYSNAGHHSSSQHAQPYSPSEPFRPRQVLSNHYYPSDFLSSSIPPSSDGPIFQPDIKSYTSPAYLTKISNPQQPHGSHPSSSLPNYGLGSSFAPTRAEIKSDPDYAHDEYGSDGESHWMDSINPDDLITSENGAGAGMKTDEGKEGRHDRVNPTAQLKGHRQVELETPEAMKRRQLEQAKLEERRQKDIAQPPPVVNGVTLRRKADLGSDVLLAALSFKGDYFNAVQSKVYDVAFESDENLVVSSPTGSGKTTIFDLAFFRMLQNKETGSEPYAIYFAPTKALCGERTRDWRQRFSQLGAKCSEVTGDTTSIFSVMKAIAESDLIITTPEKWESVTRRGDQLAARSAPALIMIDEVHFLRDTRGATLEVVVSRMKAHGPNTRFVALSATVPNIDDIARWLAPANLEPEAPLQGVYEGTGEPSAVGQEDEPKQVAICDMPKAKVYQFGEEYRPVKLEKIVRGFVGPNEWVLNKRLESELYPMIHKHTEGKPVLAFCSTRRACQGTAFEIAKRYKADLDSGKKVPWKLKPDLQNGQKPRFRDQKLADMAAQGVAFHHAGLDPEDRLKVEQMYLKGEIMMIASTSTLAVGVNLPAHTVIIMGTSAWHGPVAGFQEYSDIDVQQMMGRAGRPQFDKSGICIVMCDKTKEAKYKDLVNSRTIVESSLHTSLVEHLNTEIGLGTITSLESARKWLRSSFLYIRIQQNARHYAASVARKKKQSWKESLDHHVEEAILKLETKELVEWVLPGEEDAKDGYESDDSIFTTDSRRAEKPAKELRLTAYGKVMSSHVIRFETMCSIMKVDADATVRRLLQTLAGAAEFADLRVRPGEQQILNLLKRHPEVRYPTDDTETYADKVFLHLQACFANITFDDLKKSSDSTSMMGTQMAIFKDAPRVAKAIATVTRLRNYGRATKNALEVLHAVNGKAWEDSAVVFRQIESIGPKSIGKLEQNDVKSFDDLLRTPTYSIESWLGRARIDARRASSKPDFGKRVHDIIHSLPRYRVILKKEEMVKEAGQYPYITLRVSLETKSDWKALRHVNNVDEAGDKGFKGKKFGKSTYNLTILVIRNDGHCLDMRHTSAWSFSEKMASFLVDCELKDPEHKIEVYAGVDELSGCNTSAIYDPRLDEELFEDIQEDEDEVESSQCADSDVEEGISEPLPARKKVKTVSNGISTTEESQPPLVAAKTDSYSKSQTLPLRPTKSKTGNTSGETRKNEYHEAIMGIAKPRNSVVDYSASRQQLSKPVVPQKKPKKEPLILPTSETNSKRSVYIDDEAVESDDDEGDDQYNEDDLAFIDDRRDPSVESEIAPRASIKAVSKPESMSSQSASLVLEEYIPEVTASKRSQGTSDDFDGIESVEEELKEASDKEAERPLSKSADVHKGPSNAHSTQHTIGAESFYDGHKQSTPPSYNDQHYEEDERYHRSQGPKLDTDIEMKDSDWLKEDVDGINDGDHDLIADGYDYSDEELVNDMRDTPGGPSSRPVVARSTPDLDDPIEIPPSVEGVNGHQDYPERGDSAYNARSGDSPGSQHRIRSRAIRLPERRLDIDYGSSDEGCGVDDRDMNGGSTYDHRVNAFNSDLSREHDLYYESRVQAPKWRSSEDYPGSPDDRLPVDRSPHEAYAGTSSQDDGYDEYESDNDVVELRSRGPQLGHYPLSRFGEPDRHYDSYQGSGGQVSPSSPGRFPDRQAGYDQPDGYDYAQPGPAQRRVERSSSPYPDPDLRSLHQGYSRYDNDRYEDDDMSEEYDDDEIRARPQYVAAGQQVRRDYAVSIRM